MTVEFFQQGNMARGDAGRAIVCKGERRRLRPPCRKRKRRTALTNGVTDLIVAAAQVEAAGIRWSNDHTVKISVFGSRRQLCRMAVPPADPVGRLSIPRCSAGSRNGNPRFRHSRIAWLDAADRNYRACSDANPGGRL
jgi:hypothetical protein